MSNQSTISRMRERYLAEQVELETRLRALKIKVQTLDEVAAEEDKGRQMPLAHVLHTKVVLPPSNVTTPLNSLTGDEAAPSGLTDACIWAVKKFGQSRRLSPEDVRTLIVNHGYRPNGKNFNAVVAHTLKRVAESNRILKEKVGRSLFFRPPIQA